MGAFGPDIGQTFDGLDHLKTRTDGAGNTTAGRFALAEAKASPGLGSLATDASKIRQGSADFFRTRLQKAGRADLVTELGRGNVDLFGGFAGSGRLFEFNPNVFT